MSIKQELNITASKVSNITDPSENDLKFIESVMTNLKKDYNIEKVVGLCREEAEKGKFSYHFKIDCADYYPLSLDMIEDLVRELAIELMKPGYDFIVLYSKTSAFYEDLPRIGVIISWI